jgi:hypothetical protein
LGVVVHDISGPLLVRGNTIGPSAPLSANAVAVQVLSAVAGVRVEGNRLSGGTSSYCAALSMLAGTAVVVVDNVLDAGSCGDPEAIYCGDGSLIIANNTLFAGNSGRGVRQTNSCRATAVNNLFYGDGVWHGFQARDLDPISFQANAFLNEGPSTHADYIVSAHYPNNDDPATFAQSMTRLCAAGIPTDGNVEILATRDQIFADADRRLRLGAPGSTGGRDASMSICGGSATGVYPSCVTAPTSATGTCGAVTTDFDGAARTVPFSIGAFEQDH